MKVIVAGDFVPRGRMLKQISQRDFSQIFPEELVKTIKSSDYSIVNLESPIVDDSNSPIKKIGPNLRCDSGSEVAIQFAGFNVVTLANNHILDYGEKGLNNTLELCHKIGIETVGVGSTLKEAEKVLYLTIKDQVLAIINCCEHEFSVAADDSVGANPIKPIRQYYKILEAKQKADYVLIITHGGHEYFNLPSLRMQELFRFYIDAGADAVVNHHQHCYSGFEIYHNKPIFYGLGNFAFDENRANGNKSWHEGYLLLLDFGKDAINFQIFPYEQYRDDATVKLLDKNAFDEQLSCLNSIIGDSKRLKNENDIYYEKCHKMFRLNLEPIRNHLVLAAQVRRWLPSLISFQYLLGLYNMISCESHRDILLHYLNKIRLQNK